MTGKKKNNQVLLPVVFALSNLCLQPGGNSLPHLYFCSSAIISVLFLAPFPQLAGLHSSALYGRAGDAGASPSPAAAAGPAARSHPEAGRHRGGEQGGGASEGGYI